MGFVAARGMFQTCNASVGVCQKELQLRFCLWRQKPGFRKIAWLCGCAAVNVTIGIVYQMIMIRVNVMACKSFPETKTGPVRSRLLLRQVTNLKQPGVQWL